VHLATKLGDLRRRKRTLIIKSMQRLSLLAIAVAAAVGMARSHADGQEYGSVRGTVTDSVTGVPTIDARVALNCNGCYGREPTDSLGRYSFTRVPAGTHRIEFHCPSRTALGRELAQRAVEVFAGKVSVIDVRVPPGGCFEPAYSERTGIFRGVWTPGFESSAFVPCPDSALGLTGELLPGKRLFGSRAWAELGAAARQQPISWPKNAPRDSWGSARYFVVWRGTLKGPGTYGHMGVSEFSMIVDSILSVRAAQSNDCSRR